MAKEKGKGKGKKKPDGKVKRQRQDGILPKKKGKKRPAFMRIQDAESAALEQRSRDFLGANISAAKRLVALYGVKALKMAESDGKKGLIHEIKRVLADAGGLGDITKVS